MAPEVSIVRVHQVHTRAPPMKSGAAHLKDLRISITSDETSLRSAALQKSVTMPSKPHGAVQKPAVWLPDQPSHDFIDEDGDMGLVLFTFQ